MRRSTIHHSRYVGMRRAFLLKNQMGNDDDEEDGNNNDRGIDSTFYRDLQKAKAKKLGGTIPPEQAKEVAQESENEFLKAMKETKQEFEAAKEQFGSQGAVDLFLGKIQKEDEEERQKRRQQQRRVDEDEDENKEQEEEPFQ